MLERYVAAQLEKKTFPGISLLVAAGGDVLYERDFGLRAVQPRQEPLAPGTIYDLASLTKPLVTALLVAHFLEKKQWRLEDAPRRFLPGFPLAVSLEQLLTHSAGFKPWHPFYLYRPQDDLRQMVLAVDELPGRRVAYSDVGYILLRHLLEKIAGTPFAELAAQVLFAPLRLRRTFLRVPDRLKGLCAPTEAGNRFEREMARAEHAAAAARFSWRTEVIRGDAHDANSFYAGGSAGNAGLFSTAREVLVLAREFHPATATLLRPETVSLFWQDRTPWACQRRTLGFQLNVSAGTSGGRALPAGAIGHSGFTGTSLWLEATPQRQWVLLSNRVHPRAGRANFNIVRRRLHQLLKQELGWR
jgi:CubicO group peptidase (beta-lactamase class C family)